MLDTLTKRRAGDVGLTAQRIVALDLGSEISWAVRARDGGLVCGTDGFRSKMTETSNFRFLRFRNWLAETCREVGDPTVVFRECGSAHYRIWLPHLTACCERTHTPMRGVSTGAIKRAIAGRGTAPMTAVAAAITARGYPAANEGEAAAIAALLLAETQRNLR